MKSTFLSVIFIGLSIVYGQSLNDSSLAKKLMRLGSGTITKDSLFTKDGKPRFTTAVIYNNSSTMKLPECTVVVICPCKR